MCRYSHAQLYRGPFATAWRWGFLHFSGYQAESLPTTPFQADIVPARISVLLLSINREQGLFADTNLTASLLAKNLPGGRAFDHVGSVRGTVVDNRSGREVWNVFNGVVELRC